MTTFRSVPRFSAAQLLSMIRTLIIDKITAKPEMTKTIDHGSNLDIDAAAEQLTATDFLVETGL